LPGAKIRLPLLPEQALGAWAPQLVVMVAAGVSVTVIWLTCTVALLVTVPLNDTVIERGLPLAIAVEHDLVRPNFPDGAGAQSPVRVSLPESQKPLAGAIAVPPGVFAFTVALFWNEVERAFIWKLPV
jgi:hypothetical protein